MKSVLILASELVDNSESFGPLLVPVLLLQTCVNTVILKEGTTESEKVFFLEGQIQTIAHNTHTSGGA